MRTDPYLVWITFWAIIGAVLTVMNVAQYVSSITFDLVYREIILALGVFFLPVWIFTTAILKSNYDGFCVTLNKERAMDNEQPKDYAVKDYQDCARGGSRAALLCLISAAIGFSVALLLVL